MGVGGQQSGGDAVKEITRNELLDATAAVLNEKGWIQGRTQTKDGCCLMGAFCIASRKLHADTDVEWAAYQALKRALPYGDSVVVYQDQKGRKKEEILELLTIAKTK